ncbi:hypothetical protein [Tenacibaculum finnmarkense]|uniref:hypothetical protein n=1 Tax=Tenacibaculum finnmarkense TaxID=2781243 RepID=UPI000C4CD75E|nr:hypothetical protein [Tenacibaculum finnmarkense]MCD8440570.1 hypothetical protein [Tenacibaculum finnmarkense genomovar ulcerans]MCG8721471.1 hypothetical protein [Tenacibaculum finnmarkense]SOS55281.1 conserved membrane hypothetical protein [Tenacibaculum finnmarkense]
MKKISYIYAVFSFFLGTAIYVAQKMSFKLPQIVQFYVNDFLIMPMVLTISLVVLRWSKNNKNYQIPLWIILYSCSFYAFLYEYILPKFYQRYTADRIDVLLYFIGGFIFFILQKIGDKK